MEAEGVLYHQTFPAHRQERFFISICKVKTPAFRRVDFISSPYG